MARLLLCMSSMILAVYVTDSKACASAQAHFPFRCNDLKLFNASSVLAMDEKQSLALSNCRLKKEHVPGLSADRGRMHERQPHDRTVRPGIQAFAWHAGGTSNRKLEGTERLSQLFSSTAGLCLKLGHHGHVRPFFGLVQLLAE